MDLMELPEELLLLQASERLEPDTADMVDKPVPVAEPELMGSEPVVADIRHTAVHTGSGMSADHTAVRTEDPDMVADMPDSPDMKP